ncbi:MAG: GlmU family protein [Bacteroidales bacterium]|nr:GlmU family protein [Bacteroidales bacterium]
MNFILFDDSSRSDMFPMTLTRPVADLRLGILTIREKWEKYLKTTTSTLTEKYLSVKYPLVKGKSNILINGSVCPNAAIVKQVVALKPDEALVFGDYIIAMNVVEKDLGVVEMLDTSKNDENDSDRLDEIECNVPHIRVTYPWDLFSYDAQAIADDYNLLTKNRKSKTLSATNQLICPENIFVESGVKAECVTINASTGPVYIGKDAEIMEGSMIRGPFALCEGAVIKMGAKIYGPVTIGPYSKVGGEVSNSVIFGYTNKAHDGFLGSSVLGEWCNIGADSNNSNLKNTYDEVKAWNYTQEKFIPTGLKFCGLIMGDHSKCGINTMFNTGTVIGVNSNIVGHGFQRNFIPSFSWGNSVTGYTTYDIVKAIDVAKIVYERRGIEFGQVEQELLKSVFELTFAYRKKVRFVK